MKKLLFIISLFITATSFAQSSDNKPRVFNVKNFGAKGDSTTDDTQAIQAAINAANSAGGGEVFFPNPSVYYRINGALQTSSPQCNCQLYIPKSLSTDVGRNHITLKGESRPNYTPVGSGLTVATTTLAKKTTRIVSTLTTVGNAGASVIGTDSLGGFNNTSLSVENLAIQVKNNPTGSGPVVGGINYANGSNIYINYVVVYVDTAGFRSTLPTNNLAGIEGPNSNSEDDYSLQHCTVIGFKKGYSISEHTTLNQATAMCCYYAFYFKSGAHTTTSLRVGAYWCKYDIYVAGSLTLGNFQMDTEWQNIGKWYDDSVTVKDTANLAFGQLFYTIIQSGVGKNNSKFIKQGGTNLYASTNDDGFLSNKPTLSNPLLFSPDNTYDIGASGANRPRTIYTGTSVVAGNGINATAGDITASGGNIVATLGNANIHTTITSGTNIISGTNIGLGNSTPRAWSAGNALDKGNVNLFFGNGTDIHFNSNGFYDGAWKYCSTAAAISLFLNAGDFVVRSAASGTANAALTWVTRWTFQNAGHLIAGTDNTYDIGASGATRPRTLYVGTDLNAGGSLVLNTAGGKIKITEGTNGSVGQTTLVSGTKAITISGVTTSTRAFCQFVSIGGTVTTTWQYAAVCTANTLTITALTNAGTTDTSDTSVLNYWIEN